MQLIGVEQRSAKRDESPSSSPSPSLQSEFGPTRLGAHSESSMSYPLSSNLRPLGVGAETMEEEGKEVGETPPY